MLYSEDQIHACADAIRERMPAKEIWLFGSAARGEATEDSDVDLLVVLPGGHGIARPCFEAKLAIARARTGVPTDVVVIAEDEVAAPSSPLVADALREGRRVA
jgi:predicted nucleotidyltransferase